MVLGRDLKAGRIEDDADKLPVGTNAFIYIQVSDGINTASAEVGLYTVAPKPLVAHIVTPQQGTLLTANLPLTLEVTAYDRQEFLDDAQFQYKTDTDTLTVEQ